MFRRCLCVLLLLYVAPSTIASTKNGVDDVKLTRSLCGEPTRQEFKPIRDRSGGEEAILYYKNSNTELHYYRNQARERTWSFTAAFSLDGDDTISMAVVNRRMPCLKAKLKSPI
ncbi:MAG: hypothetical protein JWO20_995 [Candidatus Angelobacter sp.]|nr:hypothetical protein [Candidatus Angelobacter sp.]